MWYSLIEHEAPGVLAVQLSETLLAVVPLTVRPSGTEGGSVQTLELLVTIATGELVALVPDVSVA